MRKLDKEKSTPLAPVLSLRKADIKPLPDDRFVKATIPLYYQGHAYREGSRIRVTISAVGGDQPIWAFARARPKGTPAGRRRLRQVEPLEADPPGPAERGDPDRAAALPGPPRRAVPRLRAVRERLVALSVGELERSERRVLAVSLDHEDLEPVVAGSSRSGGTIAANSVE